MRRELWAKAFQTTLPVLFGYVPLGMAFGFMMSAAGYTPWVSASMSAFMYAGSAQYLAVTMFAQNASLVTMFAMVFFLNIRQMVYGLSLLDLYRGAGLVKPYLIFALTDEAYALLVGAELPKGEARKPYLLLVTALCQTYWVTGTVLGALAGAFIHINTKGMDFMLTALFLVLTIDLFKKYRTWEPFALGGLAGILALILGGQALMMPVALAIILAALSFFRGFFEAKLNGREGAGA
jgi:4-azaleucine resistance transporter AzlC